MADIACPSCGAPLKFRSMATLYLVCEYCSSLIVRVDDAVSRHGEVANLVEELTPLQIGTVGSFEGKNFTLVGRVQRGWTDGFWSEWLAFGDDQNMAWLAQAQGSYYITREFHGEASKLTVPALRSAKIGFETELRSKTFKLVDIKKSRVISYEGELNGSAVRDGDTLSLDFAGNDDRFATIEVGADDKVRVYVGKSASYEAFRFKHTRILDGW